MIRKLRLASPAARTVRNCVVLRNSKLGKIETFRKATGAISFPACLKADVC